MWSVLKQFYRITYSNHPICNDFRHHPHTPSCLLARLTLDMFEALATRTVADHFHAGVITDLKAVPLNQLSYIQTPDDDLFPHLAGLCAEALLV
jgi:hypothetical protein